jgi:ring-1,2-phenylacetyl-CoA epoxidase subunit PaaC
MKADLKNALAAKLLALADCELILGHRDSEWCGHAPILEEDIAFANIALDEIGHASVWYDLLADLLGEDRAAYPDRLVYFRDADAYRCVPFCELPKGDWAFSMLRQYLFDAAEKVWLDGLSRSAYGPIADAVAKIRTEEIYHLRHTAAWVRRLGLGTEESQRRMQAALDTLWPIGPGLFEPVAGEDLLVAAGYVPDPASLRVAWDSAACPYLSESGLSVPQTIPPGETRAPHTEHLAALLAELQKVARLDADAAW